MRTLVAALCLLAVISAASAQTPGPGTGTTLQCGDYAFPALLAYGSVLDNTSGDATTLEAQYLRALSDCELLAIWQGDARQRPPDPVIRKHVGGLGALIKQFNRRVAELTKRGVLAPQPPAPARPPLTITAYGGGTFGHNNPALGAGQNLKLGAGGQGGVAFEFDPTTMYIQEDFKVTRPVQFNFGLRWDSAEGSVDQVRNNVGGGVVNTSGHLIQNTLLVTAGARFRPIANLLLGVNFGAGPAWQDLLVRGPLGNVVLAGKDRSLAFTAGVELLYRVFGNVHAGPYLQFTRTDAFNATLANEAPTTIGSHEAYAAGLRIVCTPSQGSCFTAGPTTVTMEPRR
jgi:hypothetical protein